MGREVLVGVVGVCAGLLAGCKERAPKTSEERVTDALLRADQIAKVMPEIRRLSLDQPIKASRQSGADFRDMVRRSIADQPTVDHHAIALKALGLLEPAVDLPSATRSSGPRFR